MTNEQFQTLLQTLRAPQVQQPPPQQRQRSAAALGHITPLDMGPDKMRRLKRFNEWLEETESRMRYLGTNTEEDRMSYSDHGEVPS